MVTISLLFVVLVVLQDSSLFVVQYFSIVSFIISDDQPAAKWPLQYVIFTPVTLTYFHLCKSMFAAFSP